MINDKINRRTRRVSFNILAGKLLNRNADNSSSKKSKFQNIVLHRTSYLLLAHSAIKEYSTHLHNELSFL